MKNTMGFIPGADRQAAQCKMPLPLSSRCSCVCVDGNTVWAFDAGQKNLPIDQQIAGVKSVTAFFGYFKSYIVI